MKWIDDRTVELTPAEVAIKDQFEDWLDRGHSIPTSALCALRWARNRPQPGVTPGRDVVTDEFVKYLSDGTVEWSDRRSCPQLSQFGIDLADLGLGVCHVNHCNSNAAERIAVPGRHINLCAKHLSIHRAADFHGSGEAWRTERIGPVSTRNGRVTDEAGSIQMTLARFLVVAVLAVLLAVWLSPSRAFAAEPYGGCKEAYRYVPSQGALDCRRAGWIIRPRLTVNPSGQVRYINFPPCKQEDSGRCFWDARTMGNGRGQSFVNIGTTDCPNRIRGVRF